MLDSPAAHPFSIAYSDGFAEVLSAQRLSLAVTTYQAGRLVLLRSHQQAVNSHYLSFNRPTGLAVSDTEIALGTSIQVEHFGLSQAALSDCPAPTDRVYAQRHTHITGEIDIHDLAYGDDGLWAVNTRFNCLCTFDGRHSFVPRWRPPFISALRPADCCHLNGLAMRHGQPASVTALGTSDVPAGWRASKASGGVVIDVASGECLVQGLSMPHSPRWHHDQLWVLESGHGRLARVDVARGTLETVIDLPGFTRGLAMVGDLAFVGLSRVRETATFGELPITTSGAERHCGVWVVDLRSGQVIAALAFSGEVHELFAVEVIRDSLSPELIVDDSHNEALRRTFILPG